VNISLYHAAAALNANDRWQEMISENLASAALPGFKKQELSFQAVQAGMMPTATSATSAASRSFALPRGTANTNFAPGEMRYTSQPTDVAIDGDAFFEVQLPNGSSAFTRDGEFHISAQGQMVTKQGYPVLGDGGPIQIDLEKGVPVSIASTGEVSQGTDQKGSLRLTRFDNPRNLTQVSGGLFLATDPAAGARPATEASVRQGWLEGANTTVVTEMANLISSMRTFEANQRVIQLQDDRMSRAISELSAP
jgi:flagellar basal body rod protein FlgG